MDKFTAFALVLIGTLAVSSLVINFSQPVTAAPTSQNENQDPLPIAAPTATIIQEATLSAEQPIPIGSVVRTQFKKGDINRDGKVTYADINDFRMVYDHAAFFKSHLPAFFRQADINNDGILDQKDIDAFVALLNQP